MAADGDIIEVMFKMLIDLVLWIFKTIIKIIVWIIKGIFSLTAYAFSKKDVNSSSENVSEQ